MKLLKPIKVLENETALMDMAGLLLDLRNKMEAKYTDEDPEYIEWALNLAIARLSVKDGQDYGAVI
jgi:hypothetical protein